MPKAGEMRARARFSLENSIFSQIWLTLLVYNLLATIIMGLPSTIGSALSKVSPAVAAAVGVPLVVCSILLSGPFTYALSRIFLRVAKGDKNIQVSDVFVGFKERFADSVILAFLRSFFIFLWSLLLIIPGIVKAYAYSMAFYIQQEDDGKKTWRQCLDESAELTNGYKSKLFWLDLSFIGWFILGLLCFGIGVLWVEIYHQEARAHFYEELKAIKYGVPEEKRTEESAPEDDVVFKDPLDEDDD